MLNKIVLLQRSFKFMSQARLVLPIIVVSQFLCTSIWFAGNVVITSIFSHANVVDIGNITSAVQFGFIAGTLLFALFAISDKYSPSKVFFTSAIIGGICNFSILYVNHNMEYILMLRFFTGFFLAGIYPIGMKIIADHYGDKLGRSLGFLVAALVLGTALPHLLKGITLGLPWQIILYSTSLMAIVGGVLVGILIRDGPFRATSKFDPYAILKIFKSAEFRSVAIGYFGHCWELYAFWAFAPQILSTYLNESDGTLISIPMVSFLVIASGSLACIVSGLLSRKYNTKKLALLFLSLSCFCCILSPILFHLESSLLMVCILIFWGMVVVADSPLFSTLMAQKAPAHLKGTSLTIANCIGFLITIISIQLIGYFITIVGTTYAFVFLALGPIAGIYAMTIGKKPIEFT